LLQPARLVPVLQAALGDDGSGVVRSAFLAFDADGSGEVDAAEFAEGLRRVGVGLSEEQLAVLLRAVLANLLLAPAPRRGIALGCRTHL
jgi:hypothetical protein